MESEELKYPIGKFKMPTESGTDFILSGIKAIEELPAKLRSEITNLSDEQLDTPYREGGWTIRQVVHHLVDSHLNAYIRFRLALTEDHPTIRPYHEERWAELPDAKSASPEVSLHLLQHLHIRWVLLLRSMQENDWTRTYYHPENKKDYTLKLALGTYAWHGEHHLAHITSLKKRKNW